ncbi:hypothetical protein PCI56_00530 [Plesiomonas shigelloides subsp. oncorhynchi]|nr:hypothetical protein [Plesiomonas shigelloides]
MLNEDVKMKNCHSNCSEHNGSLNANKKWAKYRRDMLSSFPSPFNEGADSLSESIAHAVRNLNKLRPDAQGPAYLGSDPALTIDFDKVKQVELNPGMTPVGEVIDQTTKLFEGLPNWGHR